MSFTAQDVKALRDATNAGMMDCKKALTETDGDFERAVAWLRERDMAAAAKRMDRTASEGSVASYIHMGGKVGVLVEINCETDFAARCKEFRDFCNDICLHVCASDPRWVRREDVPPATIESEREIYRTQAREAKKPEKIVERIVEGKLSKWFTQVCLLEQPFVKDTGKDKVRTVDELARELSGKLGERIVIRRFARFKLGESM